MMPKFGNSNTKERIALLNRYIRLLGIETIDCLLPDREFVGEHWLAAYLNQKVSKKRTINHLLTLSCVLF
jgi:hypothetical protein